MGTFLDLGTFPRTWDLALALGIGRGIGSFDTYRYLKHRYRYRYLDQIIDTDTKKFQKVDTDTDTSRYRPIDTDTIDTSLGIADI